MPVTTGLGELPVIVVDFLSIIIIVGFMHLLLSWASDSLSPSWLQASYHRWGYRLIVTVRDRRPLVIVVGDRPIVGNLINLFQPIRMLCDSPNPRFGMSSCPRVVMQLANGGLRCEDKGPHGFGKEAGPNYQERRYNSSY
ncbi:hypothetical protein BDR07DRAFT_1406412 [Suillus spraguei]|nr:hypothetical protein BDR07DRAFT_1406412 [Suillus spraguei]